MSNEITIYVGDDAPDFAFVTIIDGVFVKDE